jgi:hypothetical protein
LGLRHGATTARLEASEEAADRGIGLSEVAVFLLDVTVPASSQRDEQLVRQSTRNRRSSGKDDPAELKTVSTGRRAS